MNQIEIALHPPVAGSGPHKIATQFCVASSDPSVPRNDIQYVRLDNPDIQKLLDVVSSIIADEYIRVAKQNKDVFSNGGGK